MISQANRQSNDRLPVALMGHIHLPLLSSAPFLSRNIGRVMLFLTASGTLNAGRVMLVFTARKVNGLKIN